MSFFRHFQLTCLLATNFLFLMRGCSGEKDVSASKSVQDVSRRSEECFEHFCALWACFVHFWRDIVLLNLPQPCDASRFRQFWGRSAENSDRATHFDRCDIVNDSTLGLDYGSYFDVEHQTKCVFGTGRMYRLSRVNGALLLGERTSLHREKNLHWLTIFFSEGRGFRIPIRRVFRGGLRPCNS